MRSLTLLAAIAAAAPALAGPVVWNFDGSYAPSSGTGAITPRAGQAPLASFGTASSFALPALPGGDTGVLRAGRVTSGFAGSGFDVNYDAAPNGGSTQYVNQYTLGYDLLLPTIGWHSFFNTNENNANDGDLFIRDTDGAVGVISNYAGQIVANTWARVMVTVDTSSGSTPTLRRYINGVALPAITLNSGFDGRWSLYSNLSTPSSVFILFGDNSGDQQTAFLSSFYFNDRVLSESEIAALGGPTAAGIPAPGAVALAGLAGLVAARRRRA